jgi:Tol biopolymer transport system component
MVSGRPAFSRATIVQTLSAIIGEEPQSLADLSPNVPVPLRWIVERCLAKDPRQRYAATADLAYDLRTVRDRLAEVSPATSVPAAQRRWHITAAKMAITFAVILAALVSGLLLSPSRPDLAAYRFTPLATDPGYQGSPAWSPDGKTIAYVADADGVVQVFTRSMSSLTRAQMTHSRFHCRDPFWSPDGARIFYTSLARDKDGLYSVSAGGGIPQPIMEDASNATISPDGRTLAFFREELSFSKTLWVSSPPGAEPRKYERPPFGSESYTDVVLHFSPDGSKILIRALRASPGSADKPEARAFWIIPWPSGDPYMVLQSLSQTTGSALPFSWLPDNRHIVSALTEARSPGTHLWLADTEADTALPLTRTNANENSPAVSPDGEQIAYSSEDTDFDLFEIPLDGSPRRTLLATSRSEMDPAWSPAGRQYAFVTDRTGDPQIWLRSLDGQLEWPLITGKEFGNARTYLLGTPAFSPDGQRIAYLRLGPEGYRIWISQLAGGPPVTLGPRRGIGVGYQDAPTWSPDGIWIAHVYTTPELTWALAKTRVGGVDPPIVIKKDISPFARPQWSADGRWIAYDSEEGLMLISPEGTHSRVISGHEWLAYGWEADSSHIYGIKQSDDLRHLMLAMVDIKTGHEQVITANLAPIPLANAPIRGFSRIAGKSFATSIVRVRSDVWLLEGFHTHATLLERLWPKARHISGLGGSKPGV